jgi:hypothetical protein
MIARYLASMLNFAVDVFPERVIFIAMFQGPDIERFMVALYSLPLSSVSAL